VTFTSLLLCIKIAKNSISTPMRSMGQTGETPIVYAGFGRFALLLRMQ